MWQGKFSPTVSKRTHTGDIKDHINIQSVTYNFDLEVADVKVTFNSDPKQYDYLIDLKSKRELSEDQLLNEVVNQIKE